jgi:hypothetical protein
VIKTVPSLLRGAKGAQFLVTPVTAAHHIWTPGLSLGVCGLVTVGNCSQAKPSQAKLLTEVGDLRREDMVCFFLHAVCDLSTGCRTRCHTIDCTNNAFLLLQKHLTSGTELILIGWKIVPNAKHVQSDHRFAPQPLANELLHSSHRYTLCFCIKQYNFHLLTYSQQPVVRHFTNW